MTNCKAFLLIRKSECSLCVASAGAKSCKHPRWIRAFCTNERTLPPRCVADADWRFESEKQFKFTLSNSTGDQQEIERSMRPIAGSAMHFRRIQKCEFAYPRKMFTEIQTLISSNPKKRKRHLCTKLSERVSLLSCNSNAANLKKAAFNFKILQLCLSYKWFRRIQREPITIELRIVRSVP